jgi:pantetheine-phosphate adenylyltransferase
MSRVAVGGTFDPIHSGHLALLARACQLSKGGSLTIGITSNEMARKKYHTITDCEIRKSRLYQFMFDEFGVRPEIIIIEDPFGPTVQEDFDYLVVSPETKPTGRLINKQRIDNGKKPIKIECVEYVLAWDNKPISSTRILNGEIDIHGRPVLQSHR